MWITWVSPYNCHLLEKVVKIIKDYHSEQKGDMKEQTLVLVSTVMTWINTPKKVKKEQKKP